MQFVRKSKGDTKSADNLLMYIRQANLSSGLKNIFNEDENITENTRCILHEMAGIFNIY
jgi:hypothetical protein